MPHPRHILFAGAGGQGCDRCAQQTTARAQLDPTALGLTFQALVFVTMRGADHATIATFEDAGATLPHVLTAQRRFGDPDYLLGVIAPDLPAFQQIYGDHLSTLPGVQRFTSTLVMKTVIEDKPLPPMTPRRSTPVDSPRTTTSPFPAHPSPDPAD